MPRMVKIGLTQVACEMSGEEPVDKLKKYMIDKHMPLIDQAGQEGVNVLCLQEIFYGPYFCAEQNVKWYESAEKVPDGPTIKLMKDKAKQHKMVMVVPVYEEEMTRILYNTAAVIDQEGNFIGKFRKIHIPHTWPGFWEKFYFKPGNLGYPAWG